MEIDMVNEHERDSGDIETTAMAAKDEHEIENALKLTGHYTTNYPNGLSLGVKLEGVPGTRGVHIDVVFVLDLRKAMFGKGGLAMRAALLETVNRDLEKVMADVGLSECLHEQSILTPWGRVRLQLLRGLTNDSLSLMHETRTIYVITENAKPTSDLSWLTDIGRIVTIDQFSLIRQSDARARLPELRKSIQTEKWHLLAKGLVRGWSGLLTLISLAIGMSTVVFAIIVESGLILIPVIMSMLSGVVGGWLLWSSRIYFSSFRGTLVQEREQLRSIGDSARISESISENEDRLQLIADLNFVVSPLIATVGDAIGSNDVDAAVNIACSVLDECVRLAPKTSESFSVMRGDEGLHKFIGLFEYLGSNTEETNLALAYVGFTSHVGKRISFGEAVSHLTELVNALYNIGALRPNIKEALDDRLNLIGLKEAMEEIDKEMQSDDERYPEVRNDSGEAEQLESEESIISDDRSSSMSDADLHEQILNASVETPQPGEQCNKQDTNSAETNSTDEIAVVGADIVKRSMKKQKSRIKESAQLALDDFECIPSGSESKAGRESAGA
jgi:hypothetical protein